jgi:inorganic pyrophosphatase
MDISRISSGRNPPHEVNVFIEIPQGGSPVKYEFNEEAVVMRGHALAPDRGAPD